MKDLFDKDVFWVAVFVLGLAGALGGTIIITSIIESKENKYMVDKDMLQCLTISPSGNVYTLWKKECNDSNLYKATK